MGYSISIKVRDRELGQKMVDFAAANIRSLEYQDEDVGLVWSNQLSYCKRKNHIGFNYGMDREWKYTLLRWMATKVGDTDKKTKQYRILYDDVEWILIDPSVYDKYGLCIKEQPSNRSKAAAVAYAILASTLNLVRYEYDYIEIDVLNKMREMMAHYDKLWEDQCK